MKEAVIDCMLLFLALRALLKHKDEEEMGKRGKRKKKYQNINLDKESDALDVTSKKTRKKETNTNLKPFERVKVPPPRDAQEGHI